MDTQTNEPASLVIGVHSKYKVDFSLKQLEYIARLTKDNEGDDKNAELLRFIVANLNTKNTTNISYSSLHNAFYGPENATIESIEKLLHHYLKKLQSDKGKA